jgi:excisionase family DNA binding protein
MCPVIGGDPVDHMGDDRLMTTADLAEYLGCHVSTIRRQIASGKLTIPRLRWGGQWRFRKSDAVAWYNRHKILPEE